MRPGSEHPEVATDLNNLGHLLQVTGRMEDAEPLIRRSLAISEKSYGPEHPTVAVRLNNLAKLLHETDRLVEAEPLLRRALAITEASNDPDHPTVATRLSNLAQLLTATGRLDEAEQMLRRALAIRLRFTRVTGQQHPYLLWSLENYQNLLELMSVTPHELAARLASLAMETGFDSKCFHDLLQSLSTLGDDGKGAVAIPSKR